MASVNKVILLGNCGRDPEVRYLPSGQAVASVTLATSTKRKDKNTGEMVEDTQWHRITFFDRLAEIAGEYVKKGNPLYIEVVSLRRLKEPRTTRTKMTLRDVQEAANALDPKHAAIVWALALTGMRPKEYWTTPWRVVLPDRVRIEGSKSAGAFRDVPLLGNIVSPSVARVTFRKAFKEKLPQWKVYDLRHAYAGILEESGVPRARRLLYMGRGPKDVQDLYEFREISEYLAADTARIIAYLDQLGGVRPTLKVVGIK